MNNIEEDNLLIARKAKKIVFIEKNISNFPNEHIVLKNKIIESLYNILENIYRSNITQDNNYKKEISYL